MAGSNNTPNERFFGQQEHRQISRLWKKAIEKNSSSRVNLTDDLEEADGEMRNVRFDGSDSGCDIRADCDPEEERKKFPSEAIQKKLLRGKSAMKIRSPLQKFDEIVTKELTNRKMAEEGGGKPSLEGARNWSCMQVPGLSDYGHPKVTTESKVSRGVLFGFEKEVKELDPADAQHAALLDAIEKLAQAQAFCRFDAAVKAAEAATAAVPEELAEEVAMACAKDYQSEIVDVINEKIPLSEEKKPLEVIGYIGVTKLKDNM